MGGEYIDREALLEKLDVIMEETREQLIVQVREKSNGVLRGRYNGLNWCRNLILEAPAVNLEKPCKKSKRKERVKRKPSHTVCLIQDCFDTYDGCCYECKIEDCKDRCKNTPDKCGCMEVRKKKGVAK